MDPRKIHEWNEIWKEYAPAIVGIVAIGLLVLYGFW